MKNTSVIFRIAIVGVVSFSPVWITAADAQDAHATTINPATLPRVGQVSEKFQSYNIEMVEVTGGRFWKPYGSTAASAETKPSSNQPAGMDPSLYEYRAPINLSNPRLRKLAAALGPAYLRVSGTWANTTYFQNNDQPAELQPPKGFKGVLTRAEWKGVNDFARAVNAEIVTSFSIGTGTRNGAGEWTPAQAQSLIDYTKSIGGHIAAAEFMNEPNLAEIGGAPKGYDAAAYARDIQEFRKFAKASMPGTILLGPGTVGEGSLINNSAFHTLTGADLLTATGPVFDAFSYHFYGAVSSRCGAMGSAATTTAEAAFSDEWLERAGKTATFYTGMRDRLLPGKTIWNTETAQAACGGDKWASTFLDTFRYLNQLGSEAKLGVQVNMHNTLAASDYGLLQEGTYEPRPNYWAAVLWHRLMGTTVLDAGMNSAPGIHLYAHCLNDQPGGVALLVINAGAAQSSSLQIPDVSRRYTLTAHALNDKTVELNGTALQLQKGDALPLLEGVRVSRGAVTFAPESITFLEIQNAGNKSCK